MANYTKSYKIYVDGDYTETIVVPGDYDRHNLKKCILSCASVQVKLGPKRKINSMRTAYDKVELHTYKRKSLQISRLA